MRKGTRGFNSLIDSLDWNQRNFIGNSLSHSRGLENNQSFQGASSKLHTLALAGLKLRDSAAIYSRVDVSRQQLENLKTMCQHYFSAHCSLLSGVNPTVWTLGYGR